MYKFLVEAVMENIVFSNQKYHGDSLNFVTQRKIASLAQEKKSDTSIFHIHTGGKGDTVISRNSLLRTMNFFSS